MQADVRATDCANCGREFILLTSRFPSPTLSDANNLFPALFISALFRYSARTYSMFIPLKDLNPSRTYPFVNITLILANIAIFIYSIGLEATLPPRPFQSLLLSYSPVPPPLPPFLAPHLGFEVSFL